jgi:hypothetical protein
MSDGLFPPRPSGIATKTPAGEGREFYRPSVIHPVRVVTVGPVGVWWAERFGAVVVVMKSWLSSQAMGRCVGRRKRLALVSLVPKGSMGGTSGYRHALAAYFGTLPGCAGDRGRTPLPGAY